eukprot:10514525-Alexandrium_andersonii.AAC.1
MSVRRNRLRSRPEAVKKLLASLSDQPRLQQVAAAQAKSFLGSLQGATLSAGQAASLSERVEGSAGPLAPQSKLIEQISEAAAAEAAMPNFSGHSQLGGFRTGFPIPRFGAVASVAKRCRRPGCEDGPAASLGLARPKEGTARTSSVLYRATAERPRKARLLPWGTKLGAARHVKRMLDAGASAE